MTPMPPGAGHYPPSFPSTEQGWFTLNTPDPGVPNAITTTGPFLCTRVPYDGELQIAGKSGVMVTVDERVKMPLEAAPTQRSVLVDVATGDMYEIVYLQRYADFVMVSTVRKAAT